MKISTVLFCALAASAAIAQDTPPVFLADPLQGTDSVFAFSHGNTYPAISLPFPMNKWAPYTQPAKDSFYYQYRQPKLRGIRQTHQPSPWIGDYAAFSLMPVSGTLAVNEEERASEFRHETETAQPSYYRVRMDTWNAVAEVTPTERCALFRFTFEKSGDSYVVLDAFPGGSSVAIDAEKREITGFTRYNRGGVPDGFANYFVIVFDRAFDESGVWTPQETQPGITQLDADHAGAFVKFNTNPHAVIGCRVASSFISLEQARRNLQREVGSADFDTVRKRAETRWNEMLGRIKIEGGTYDQHRTFYSALYRSLLFPHKFYELNAQNKPEYFSPYDGKVYPGFLYTDTGYWDTFRAAHPLYNLVYPEISEEILPGILQVYEQSGWLPAWTSPGHKGCMIGNHAFSLLADGWVKGIRNFDLNKAVAAMVHDANTQGPDHCRSIGRDGAEFYNRLGYAPYPEVKESTAKTLEYAYNDWCAAILARAAGQEKEAMEFEKNAQNYRNVFDTQTGFVRGKKSDGSWLEPFDPKEWGGPFTEGCSWHWTWSVFHNIPDLIKLMGGDEAFTAKLDGVFTAPNTFGAGTYSGVIHEMVEMAALNLGQYAHGNQPIQHMVYLYDYAGQPWKTQSRVRQVMSLLYQATPDGLCGDEDNGQTSAWYVFSALGFYPVCPGDPHYAIGSPLFDRAVLSLPQGKSFVINARENGPQRPYIQEATLNGNPFPRTFLAHDEITGGGEIDFRMGSAPNEKWGAAPENRPPTPSLSPKK
jgi:predicted alpha-1,2-mannosidase